MTRVDYSFEGITDDCLFLLAENRFHDSKSFYEDNKAVIRSGVIEPLRHLVSDLAPTILSIDPLLIVNPLTNGCVSRVRRDTRYSRDKSLYRENMWIAFLRDKKAWNYCLPAFYLDFSIRRTEWGLGFYSASPEIMRILRKNTEKNCGKMTEALLQARRAGFELGGEPYARRRSTDDIPELLRPLYDCRSVNLMRTESSGFVSRRDLPETLCSGFRALASVYDLLIASVEESVKS